MEGHHLVHVMTLHVSLANCPSIVNISDCMYIILFSVTSTGSFIVASEPLSRPCDWGEGVTSAQLSHCFSDGVTPILTSRHSSTWSSIYIYPQSCNDHWSNFPPLAGWGLSTSGVPARMLTIAPPRQTPSPPGPFMLSNHLIYTKLQIQFLSTLIKEMNWTNECTMAFFIILPSYIKVNKVYISRFIFYHLCSRIFISTKIDITLQPPKTVSSMASRPCWCPNCDQGNKQSEDADPKVSTVLQPRSWSKLPAELPPLQARSRDPGKLPSDLHKPHSSSG